jgi:hypothetical protein
MIKSMSNDKIYFIGDFWLDMILLGGMGGILGLGVSLLGRESLVFRCWGERNDRKESS